MVTKNELLAQNELLKKALEWALKNGVSRNSEGDFSDSGCGCCSYPIQPDSDVAELLKSLGSTE